MHENGNEEPAEATVAAASSSSSNHWWFASSIQLSHATNNRRQLIPELPLQKFLIIVTIASRPHWAFDCLFCSENIFFKWKFLVNVIQKIITFGNCKVLWFQNLVLLFLNFPIFDNFLSNHSFGATLGIWLSILSGKLIF